MLKLLVHVCMLMYTYANLAELVKEQPGLSHKIIEYLSKEKIEGTEDIPLAAVVLSYDYESGILRMNLDLQTVDEFADEAESVDG